MIRRTSLLCLGVLFASQTAFGMTPVTYTRVMNAVTARDLNALKQLKSAGVDMNSPTPNGMTPLCETVVQGDYEGYEMLTTQGASPYVSCIRRLPPETVADFYANQPPPHTYYTGHLMEARAASSWGAPALKNIQLPMLGIGEILLAGVATAGILTLGHGGSSGGNDPEGNELNWNAPLSLEPSTFETNEYKAAQSGWTGTTNFLGSIKASSAYARGYTGYKVKRKDDGTLEGEGEAAIDTNNKVKVAVLDTGVWSKHPDLNPNINSEYNYVYGVCSDGNTQKCWKLEPNPIGTTGKFEVHLYENYGGGSSEKDLGYIGMTGLDYLVYATKYSGYNYDSSDASPYAFKIWKNSAGQSLQGFMRDGELYIYDPDHPNSSDPNGAWQLTCDSSNKCWYGTDYYVIESTDLDNHGTHVAGLVGATKNDKGMMGVAYNAEIVPVKMDLDIGLFAGMSTAVQNADIVNASIMSGSQLTGGRNYADAKAAATAFESLLDTQMTDDLLNGYRSVAENNKILVVGAGNYTGSSTGATPPYDPNPLALAPLSDMFNGKKNHADGKTYNLSGLMVNVVAVGSDNKLAPYSAKCGVTKDYCIAAPGGVSYVGERIYSTIRVTNTGDVDTDYGYGAEVGTSMAAPIVSGAIAVIKGAFPHLTNQQVVQILFETATDLGDKGVDEVYGHGLVNLAAATDPVGLQKISLSTKASGASVAASSSTATVPASFAGVAEVLPANLIVLDKYNRAFERPTSSFVRVAKRENKLENRFKSFMRGNEQVVADTDTFKMAYSERRSKLNGKGISHGSMTMEIRPTTSWHFKTFYSENTETSGGSYFERIMRAPYAKMKEAWGGAIGYDLSKNWHLSVLGQVGQNGFVDEDDLNDMDHNKVSLFQSALQYNGLKKVGLKLTAGVSNEQGSTLGMWGRGAFKSGNSRTAFVGAGVSLNLTDAVTIEGMYYSGITRVNNGNSLVKMSNLRSDSFALTAAWQVNEGRTIGLQFVSPLRVRRGTATLDLPVGRDAYQDVVYRQSISANLKPTAREYDLGLYYADDVKEDVHFQSEFGVRLNPDHVAGANPDWRALVGLRFGL